MEGIPLFVVTVGLTAGLAFMLVSGDIQNIKENWDNRRCELPIMMMGNLFKPSSFQGSPSEFATENMNFCTRQLAKSVLVLILAPVTAILGKQSDVLGILGNSLNMMRTLLSNATGSFGKLIEPFYRRFLLIGGNFRLVFQQFLSAMNRVFAIGVSQIFMGISAVIGMQNIVSFVIKVVMIIMAIIIAIFILLFFVLAPFLPIILSVIGILASVGIAVSGTEVFCFSPDTEIILETGYTKPISQIQVGDKLPHGGEVEGILLTTRDPMISMFSYKGVKVSGSHLVWEYKKWVPVNCSEKAHTIDYEGERLYSLRTTSREIFAKNSDGDVILFKDWEEIPAGNDKLDAEWDILVQSMLGNTIIQKTPSTTDPLFSPNCFVTKDTRLVPISTIQIGDIIGINIKGDKTRVIGIYTGEVDIDPDVINQRWNTDGVWWRRSENWVHTKIREAKSKKIKARGIHLITDSGIFWVHAGAYSGIVRDFTEVGSDRIMEATVTLLNMLNEKPKP